MVICNIMKSFKCNTASVKMIWTIVCFCLFHFTSSKISLPVSIQVKVITLMTQVDEMSPRTNDVYVTLLATGDVQAVTGVTLQMTTNHYIDEKRINQTLNDWGLTNLIFKNIKQDFDGSKTEMVFKINNVSEHIIGLNQTNVYFQKMDARVSWVGAPASSSNTSLRVDVGSLLKVVIVGDAGGSRECLMKDHPCYFLQDSSLKEPLQTCVTGLVDLQNLVNISQCADVKTTKFKAMEGNVLVNLTSDNTYQVYTMLPSNPAYLEVTAFEPSNPGYVHAKGIINCVTSGHQTPSICSREGLVSLPKDMQQLKVVLVAIDAKGDVIESNLTTVNESVPSSAPSAGLIAGAVIGSLLGVVVIVLLVLIIIKKMNEKKQPQNKRKPKDGTSEEAVKLKAKPESDTVARETA